MEFTREEISKILEITERYSELMRESASLQRMIEEAEHELLKLANRMEELRERETHLFYDLSAKYDVEPKTLQVKAANMIIQGATS